MLVHELTPQVTDGTKFRVAFSEISVLSAEVNEGTVIDHLIIVLRKIQIQRWKF